MKKTVVLLVLVVACTTVMAGVSPAAKLNARRAAEIDGYRKMTERIMGLKLSSNTCVRDFVAESDQIITHMDHFIKGIRIDEDQTTFYSDGTCEVVVEVTLSKVITELKTSCDKYCKGGKWRSTSFESIKTYTKDSVLEEIGSGAVRENSVIAEPASVPIVMEVVNPRDKQIDLPAIYSKYPAKNRLMAKRIATVDAYRKLAERIYGLRITADTTVRDFDVNMSSDVVRGLLEHELRGMRVDEVRYQPDGIVEVQVSLTLEQVITTLKTVSDKYYSKTGRLIKSEKFEDIKKETKHKTITALGMGAVSGTSQDRVSTSGMQGSPIEGTETTTTTTIKKEGPEVIKFD